MKIVHLINSLATGGAERLVVDLAAHGINNGHDVTIALLRDTPGIPRTRAKELNIPLLVLGDSLKDPRLIQRISAATSKADIVHVHLFPSLYWAAFTGRPMVFTEHNTHNRRRGNPLYRLTERKAYQKYLRIIAISEGVADSVKRHLKEINVDKQVSTAVNGIADEFFDIDRRHSDQPTRLVSVGSFSPQKQHHLAIEAVSLLENVTLQIAGDGRLRGQLEERIRDLRLDGRVELLGNIEDIPGLLKKSDLFISTSAYEGFGIAAGEAQAAGLPVVGPNVAGLREVVIDGRSGLLYNDSTPQSIADTIQKALSADTYRALASNARVNASRFSLAKSFDSQMRIYQEVLNG